MTPAELARIRSFARRLLGASAVTDEGRVPGVWLRADTRVKVCEALTALADRVEDLELELASAENALREAGER